MNRLDGLLTEMLILAFSYEIQVSPDSRGLGLGKILMRCLEGLAKTYEMQKVMLTVFEGNSLKNDTYLKA